MTYTHVVMQAFVQKVRGLDRVAWFACGTDLVWSGLLVNPGHNTNIDIRSFDFLMKRFNHMLMS